MRDWLARIFPLVSLLTLLSIQPLLGQGERGAITGVVADPTGAVIPGVEVTVTNKETGVSRTVLTTDAGVYRVPALPPGTYTVSAALSGFKTAVADNVIVRVAQTITVDF